MKNATAVIFSDTVPDEQVLIPLVPVFAPVVYCLPVENEYPVKELNGFCQHLMEESRYTFHAPAPLGENRERFLHLVKDLRTRRDDYGAQLAHVSLAGIPSGSQAARETKSSILGSLLARHGIDSDDQEMVDKLLWQARLILKLAEQFDEEQRVITEEMQNIKHKEQELFVGMVRESESPFSLTGTLGSLNVESDRLHHLRRKAWARLFALGSSTLPGRIFLSTDRDGVERLNEEYERITGQHPGVVLELPLPAVRDEEYLNRVSLFHEEAAQLLAIIVAMPERQIPFNEDQLHEWNEIMEKSFPSATHGRCILSLNLLSGIKVRQLFLESFGHDKDGLEAKLTDEQTHDIVLGLLQPA